MISRQDIKDIYPLTPFQEGLVFHDVLEREAQTGGPQSYVQQLCFSIHGPLDVQAFASAWQFVVDRHDIFRTVFRPTGAERPLQIVLKQRQLDVDVIDHRPIGASTEDATAAARREADRYEAAQRVRSFDIQRDGLLRIGLLRITDTETRVAVAFHHLLMDGWCIGILQDDLTQAYRALVRGEAPRLPQPVPFGRFVKASESRRAALGLTFWRTYLQGYEAPVEVPGRIVGAPAAPRQPETREMRFGPEITADLNAFARRLGITPSTLLQVLWGVLLAKLENRRDVVFGAVASTRMADLPGNDAILGPCIGMLPLRVRYAEGETVSELLRRAQREGADWLAHVHCALADVQGVCEARGGLLSHYFVYENYPLDEGFQGEAQVLAPGVTIHDVRPVQTNNYDFGVLALPGADLRLVISFNAQAVDAAIVDRLGGWLRQLAVQMMRSPEADVDDLTLLSAEEDAELRQWGAGAAVEPAAPIAAWWRDMARARSVRPAVRVGDRVISYAELEQRSARLAVWLQREHRLPRGAPVGLSCQASDRMAVAMIACQLIGSPYVPIEPSNPPARTAHVLRESGARILLADCMPSPELGAGVDALLLAEAEAAAAASDPADLSPVEGDPAAYIIFTSGTTGAPKGVSVGQRALANYVRWLHRLPEVDADMRTVLVSSPAFDLGYTGLFGALLGGGCVSLLDEEERRDPAHVLALLQTHGITLLKTTPSYLSLLLAAPEGEASLAAAQALRLVLLGGEPQNFADLQRLKALHPALRIYNHYGPTETTIGCVAGGLDDLALAGQGPQRIGRPIDGAQVFVCDQTLSLMPAGIPGELLVGGEGVAHGYVNAAPADAARFTQLPSAGRMRVYRTGDRVRWLADGTLEFLGRNDDQVKIRGYRVSLKEVEAALRATASVQDAAVIVDSRSGSGELAAYLIPTQADALSPGEVRRSLAARLPQAMVPSRFHIVSRFPLTANGKVDRKALTALWSAQGPAGASKAAPTNAMEQAIADIWKQVLFLDDVGIDDDFFALGGHSLKAILIASKVRAAFDRPVSLRSLFDHPTVRAFAAHLAGGATADEGLLRLRTGSATAPVAAFFPPALGTATVYREFLEPLAIDLTCVGLQAPGFDRDVPFAPDLEAYAEAFASALAPVLDRPPLRLVGWSFGAVLALATALRLEAQGHAVELLLLDSAAPPRPGEGAAAGAAAAGFAELRTRPYWGRVLAIMDALPPADLARIERLARHHHAIAGQACLDGTLRGPITCIEASGSTPRTNMAAFGRFTTGRFKVHEVGGDHYSMFHPPHVSRLIALLEQTLSASVTGSGAIPAARAVAAATW